MDITELNWVNKGTEVKPNYDISEKEPSITLYFDNDNDVIIVGTVDPNYICWASRTKTNEKEINEAIFNHIANEKFTLVSQPYYIGLLDYDDLKLCYRTDLIRLTEDKDMAWKTPFGHYYGKSQIQYNGRFFAGDVVVFLKILHRRCNFREADGAYESMLDFWLSELSIGETDALYYPSLEPLFDMIKSEGYLILSQRAAIREKYLILCKKMSNIYGRYMDIAR